MASDALLQPRVLRVPNRIRSRVALQTERVRAGRDQHARIRGTMGSVTGLAAVNLDGFVLKDKRSAFVAVALEANHVLIRRRAELAFQIRAVCVVAIGAFDQAFFHAMMEGFLKIGLLFRVTGEAQSRLFGHEQELPAGVMHRVAVGARDAILVVHRPFKLLLFVAGGVAGQAAPADTFRLCAFEGEDLGLISAALHVPTVVILGPMDERYTTYAGSFTHTVCKDIPCRPCNMKRCDRDHACVNGISPEEVFHKVEEVL